MKEKSLVGVNDFVYRQTKENLKTYSRTLSFKEIAQHSELQFKNGFFKEGYRDGVVVVYADQNLTDNFICPFTKINEKTKLKANAVKRSKNESFYIQIRALNGIPLKTSSVELILYRSDVLAENNEQSTDSEWELISFHAIPEGVKKMPMGPVTMMRNQLKLEGGTKGYYESQEWAKSIEFWQKYAVLDNQKT